MVARLLYGFRVSIWFALALTFVGTVLGIAAGALQGYFGGRVDLFSQRLIEIWGAIPELYLLIIFASIFEPSLLLLLILLSLWGWIGLSDYVRAEFLRNRSLEFVKAARALGLSNAQIIWRHVLPNSMTPVITFLPFRMSGAIIALTSLDFLGLGVPAVDAVARRPAAPGQEQPRRLVDHLPDLRAAGRDDAAADLHRRRAARRVRHPQVMSERPHDPAPAGGPLLEIEHLAVRFGAGDGRRRRLVLDRAGREVRAGRRVGLGQVDHRAVGAAPGRRGDDDAAAIRFDGEDLMQKSRARDARHPRRARSA